MIRKAIGCMALSRTLLMTAGIFLSLLGSPTARAQNDAPITLQFSQAAEASHIFRNAGPGTLYGWNTVNTNAAVRWVLFYDQATVPADGTGSVPIWWELLSAGGSVNAQQWTFPTVPIQVNNGLVIVCSTTGPFQKTQSADCGFSVQMR